MTIESKTHAWLLESAQLKETVLARFADMPELLREKAPSKDDWSAAGVVEHLILVEEQLAGPWREQFGNSPPVAPGLSPGF